MKKPLFILGAVVFAAFAAISILKYRNEERTVAASGPGGAEVERVKNFWAVYNQANALRAQGEYARAADGFREALALNPQHEDSLYYLGTSLYEIGEYGRAAGELRKIVAANPASGRAWSELGNTLSVRAPGAPQDFAEARGAYEHAAELNREQAGPFLRMGLLDLNRGKRGAALANFRLAAGFGSPEGSYLLAYTDFLEKRDEDALRPLRKILDAYAKDKRVTGLGVLSEGDVLPTLGQPLTALDKSALKSILMFNWEAKRLGGFPSGVPKEFRVLTRADAPASVHILGGPPGIRPGGGRGAWADINKDGREDLIVAGLGRTVALYKSDGQSFSDVTSAAGLAGVRDVWDAVWADYDGDGYPDLYLLRSGYTGTGQNLLYHNNRDGTFTNVTARMRLAGDRSTARACFVDFSGSGRMDLVEVGTANSHHSSVRLYRNDGKEFVEVTGQAGLDSKTTAVDCAAVDYDRDGKQDMLILYWKQGAALYHNEGNFRFSNATRRAGLDGLSGASYSATFLDYDHDHWPDLLISTQAPVEEVARCLLQPNFHAPRDTPRLFHNLANGRFEDVTQAMGLDRCYGTLQVLADDLDSDGWPDLVMVNGSLDAERLEPSVVLHNLHGRGFQEWFYLTGNRSPSNLVGAAIAKNNGKILFYIARNPLLPGSVAASGLFTCTFSAASPVNRSAVSSEPGE